MFIAIDLDNDGLNKISDFQNSLKQATSYIRWTKKETWHLTLKFLGEQNKNLLNQIIEICKNAKNSLKSFTLRINGAGAFPNIRLPKVIYLNIVQNDDLFKLYNHLETQLAIIGIPKEDRNFSPHLTLGRVKDPKALLLKSPDFLNLLLNKGKTFNHTFDVHNFCLYQSVLKKEGPEYVVIEKFSL